MGDVYEGLIKQKVETTLGFGIYYDPPKETPAEKLRSIGGCVIAQKDTTAAVKAGFKVSYFPASQSVATDFPYKGVPSIVIGAMRVYPAMGKYLEKKGYQSAAPMIEIYDMPNVKTTYAALIWADKGVLMGYLE